MIILFTRSGKIGSRLIRAVTGEDISHVAVQTSENIIVHATFHNVDIDGSDFFQHNNEIVRRYRFTGAASTLPMERRAILLEGNGYDFTAFIGMGLRLVLLRSLGIAIPALGKWASRGKFICTEFVDTIIGQRESNSQITPGQLEQQLLTSGQWTLIRERNNNG